MVWGLRFRDEDVGLSIFMVRVEALGAVTSEFTVLKFYKIGDFAQRCGRINRYGI